MSKIRISKEQARSFIVRYQGLQGERQYKGKQGIVDFVSKVGCIQYDTLNIVGRNPDLVLQARIKDYKPSMLYEVMYKDRLLIDQWDKEMSIYSVKDWPYFELNRKEALSGYKNKEAIKACIPYVREVIEKKGPVTSADLELNETIDWAWAPTRLSRAVLEAMYFWGELIVYSKINSRKVYDFASRHIPSELLIMENPNKTMEQYYEWHVLRRIGAVGLMWNKGSDAWLGIKKLKAEERNKAFEGLLEKGLIMEIEVEGLKQPLYIKSEYESLLREVINGEKYKIRGAILAPLDNMLWDRKLIQELFDFEYRWEVYKPADQRKYGYYVLPVLYGNEFVARFEPVLDKESSSMIIKNWWWEPHIKVSAIMRKDLESCLRDFMRFTGSDNIVNDLSNY
jgi:uncharacterized protein YcaQ